MRTLRYLHDLFFAVQRETRGAVATEYAFLITFIIIAALAAIIFLGAELNNYLITLGNAIGGAAQQS